jgi:hypothetical protein
VPAVTARDLYEAVLDVRDFPSWARGVRRVETYEGSISGYGECTIEDLSYGTLAEFRTELRPAEPALKKLMQSSPVRNATSRHLKRCLAQLGQVVSGGVEGVRAGPLAISPQLLPG